MPTVIPPVYDRSYSDQPAELGADGCVGLPEGDGLGVVYDWDRIESTSVERVTFGKS